MEMDEYFGSFRLVDFDAFLRASGIPISGVGQNGDAPAGIVVNYLSEATAEQITTGNAAKETFDWRRRRSLTRAQIVTAWQGLTTAQQVAFRNHWMVESVRQQPGLAVRILAEIGVPLSVDEAVDPT